jgi:hypothetical protein
VFLVNSRHPLACAPRRRLPGGEARFSRGYAGNLPSSFDAVRSFTWVCSTSPPVSVSGTVHERGLFPGGLRPPPQSDQGRRRFGPVTTRGPRNVDLVAIGYACRPRLRGRLTLRGSAWRRNHWTSGGSVSHAPRATHVSIRTPRASSGPRGPPSPAWGTLRYRAPGEGRARGFGAWLEPRYIFGAGQLNRPVSCYAFFKGWLLLSQPPGCPGRPTSFPT